MRYLLPALLPTLFFSGCDKDKEQENKQAITTTKQKSAEELLREHLSKNPFYTCLNDEIFSGMVRFGSNPESANEKVMNDRALTYLAMKIGETISSPSITTHIPGSPTVDKFDLLKMREFMKKYEAAVDSDVFLLAFRRMEKIRFETPPSMMIPLDDDFIASLLSQTKIDLQGEHKVAQFKELMLQFEEGARDLYRGLTEGTQTL